MPGTQPDEAQARKLVWRYISEIGTCMMVTHAGDTIRARPMRGLARPEANTIWFFADRHGLAAEEGAETPRACLTYADTKDQTYVSVSGSMSVVEDRATIAELSNAAVEAYFPGLPDNAEVVLLKFVPEHGEYWDAPSSPILLAIRFLQATITGERPSLGANGAARLGQEDAP